jgi:hypothetical protein
MKTTIGDNLYEKTRTGTSNHQPKKIYGLLNPSKLKRVLGACKRRSKKPVTLAK